MPARVGRVPRRDPSHCQARAIARSALGRHLARQLPDPERPSPFSMNRAVLCKPAVLTALMHPGITLVVLRNWSFSSGGCIPYTDVFMMAASRREETGTRAESTARGPRSPSIPRQDRRQGWKPTAIAPMNRRASVPPLRRTVSLPRTLLHLRIGAARLPPSSATP